MSTATPFYDNLVDELDWSPEELSPKLEHNQLMAQYPTRMLDGDKFKNDVLLEVVAAKDVKMKQPAKKKAAPKKKGNNSNA